jgi:hypothetical protein
MLLFSVFVGLGAPNCTLEIDQRTMKEFYEDENPADIDRGFIFVEAAADIKKGEQLLTDYGKYPASVFQ